MSVPDYISNTNLGASNSLVASLPTEYVDVRDHGARLDGSHDDSGAIQTALDEAAKSGTPDLVYLPEGTAHIAQTITLSSEHSGVTLKGAGSGSHLRLAGGFTRNHQLLKVDARRDSAPVTDVTFRDFRIDGQGDTQSDKQGWGILVWDSGNGDDNLLIENLWTHEFSGSNLQLMAPGTTVRFVSSWGARHYHGIGIECSVDDSSCPVVVEYAHCRDNQIHGVDCSHGHTVVKHVLSEENGWGGKNSDEGFTGYWEDVVFRNNEKCGYMSIEAPHRKSITMKRVMAYGNGWTGLRLVGDTDFILEDVVALENDTKDARRGNIFIGGGNTVSGTSIRTGSPANGPALEISSYDTGTPVGSVSELVHDGSTITNESDVTFGATTQSTVDPLPLPTNPDAGGDGTQQDSTSLPSLLVIDGSSIQDSLNYEITVSGEIEKTDEVGSINDVDVINGSTATGWVTGTVDGYRFSGDITDMSFSQSQEVDKLSISVDGEEIPLESPSTPTENTLEIQPTDTQMDLDEPIEFFVRTEGPATVNTTESVSQFESDTVTVGFSYWWPTKLTFTGKLVEAHVPPNSVAVLNGDETPVSEL